MPGTWAEQTVLCVREPRSTLVSAHVTAPNSFNPIQFGDQTVFHPNYLTDENAIYFSSPESCISVNQVTREVKVK